MLLWIYETRLFISYKKINVPFYLSTFGSQSGRATNAINRPKLDVPIYKLYWFCLKGKKVYFENNCWLSWKSFTTTVHSAQKRRQNQEFLFVCASFSTLVPYILFIKHKAILKVTQVPTFLWLDVFETNTQVVIFNN